MKRVTVYHSMYGCETGCCGHTVEIHDEAGKLLDRDFAFSHPYSEAPLEFAKRLVQEELGKEHTANLDWDNADITTSED